MKMKKIAAAMTALSVSTTAFAGMMLGANAADPIAQAYLVGAFGTESNWEAGENAGVSVTSIEGDGQYECTWELATATSTGSEGFFVTVVIEPVSAENFTTDTFPDLAVSLDEVWVDGVQLTDFDASAAVDTAYYESSTGVTRIYLRGDWAGNATQILGDNLDITSDIKVLFSVSGTGATAVDPGETIDPTDPGVEAPPVYENGQYGNAYFIGAVGGDQSWSADDFSAYNAPVAINGNGTYELQWDLQAGGTDTVQFLAAVIEPTDVDNFTTDTFENLTVTLDEVWIDGVQLTDYTVSDAAVNTAYYEGATGVTRIYLHDEWAGTGVADLPSATTIAQSVKIVFTVDGLTEIVPSAGALGDINADGAVDATDASAILIAAAAVGSGAESGLTAEQETNADVNGDGGFDATDAAFVLQYAAATGTGYTGTLADFMAENA